MALQLFHLFIAGVLGSALLILVFVDRRAGLAAIFVAAVTQGVNPRPVPLPISVTLYFPDLIFAALAATVVLRFGVVRRSVSHPVPIAVLALALAWSELRGLHALPNSLVVAESREIFYLLVGPAYLLSFGRAEPLRRELLSFMLWLGAAFSLVAAYHTMTQGLGTANTGVVINGIYETARIVNASEAVTIGVAGCICVYRWWEEGRRWYLFLALWMLGWTTLAQHRSVWVGTGLGLLALFLFAPFQHKVKAAALFVYGGILLLPLMVLGPLHPVLGVLADSWATISGAKSTYGWREAGWSYLIDQLREAGRLAELQGFPFGSGYGRTVAGSTVTVSPHNFYVTLLLRGGVVALGAYALVLIQALRQRDNRPLRWAFVVFLASYSWAYSLGFFTVPLLAWLMSKPGEVGSDVAAATSAAAAEVAEVRNSPDFVGLERL